MHLLLQVGLACSLITACLARIPDCSLVDCRPPDCLDQYTPYGQCCPICKPKQPCTYKDRVYKEGQRFKDECNTCSCTNGAVVCTEMACLGKDGSCPVLKGKGDVADMCVRKCSSDYDCPGVKKCCSKACDNLCLTPTRNPKTCTSNGIIYKEGESVPPSHRCLTDCVCQAGQVNCLPVPCAPDVPNIK
ncbi:kielin/chordin-like protein isoform X1 [Dreissena polymorpha]|uniref:kielin/chordin-like protein isoform X1 n=1 Tax=Dreissena polymorpha TaxID=45954 RepID=UPI0022644FC7|nr:kielin/chordin-like protein isoform X1 [Dreissena polymorpha]